MELTKRASFQNDLNFFELLRFVSCSTAHAVQCIKISFNLFSCHKYMHAVPQTWLTLCGGGTSQ